MGPPAPLGCDPGVGASVRSGVSVAAEALRPLDVEGVEVDVADVLEELGGPGVGQGLGQTVSPGLVFLLQGPELGRGPALVRAGAGPRPPVCARGGPW